MDKGHGRLEKRTLETTTILTKAGQWAGLKQGLRITRERTIKGETTVEVHYGITSLSEQQADAKRLLGLVRDHWSIENNLHWTRDVVMGEDGGRIRKESAPQVMAGLRNSIIHLVDGVASGLASAIRTMNNCLSQALSLLGLPQLE